MLIDSTNIYPIQLRHHALRQPHVLILIAHLNACRIIACGSDEGQILCGRAPDRDFFLGLHFFAQMTEELIRELDGNTFFGR